MKIFLPVLFALVLVLSFSLIPVVPAAANGANTWYVDATLGTDNVTQGTGPGTDAFETITYAISQASGGDTISVAAGTYAENVEVNKQLTLTTGDLSQPGNVVVGAGGGGSAITLTVDGCVLQGFKVQNGRYGIYLEHSNDNMLTDNIANSNTEHGIYLEHSNNNTLTSNIANSNSECGIYLDRSSNNTLTGNTANSNSECGIYLDNGDSNTLTSNIANSNTKYGIYLDGNEGSHGNTLTGNTANQNSECGIYLDRSSNNTLTRNTVSRNTDYGINLDGSNNNTLTENTVSENNEYGINLDGSNNNTLTANHITGNNIGVRIQQPVDASTININFNNIYGNTTYGVDNTYGTSDVDAENNWWGANGGPSTSPGSGDKVSGNVDYDPWLGSSLVDLKAETTASGDQTVDAKTGADTEVDKSGTGTPTITVAKYSSNPGTGFSGDTGKYIDVHVDNTTDVDEIVIKVYYTNAEIAGLVESSLRLHWWNSSTWILCSDSGVTYPAGGPTYRGYMWAKIRNDTIPNLTQLTGSVFGGGVPSTVAVVFLPAISNLTITPTEVKIEEAVTITAQVTNECDGPGSYTVTLKINGVVEEKKTVTLAPWEKKTVTLTVIKDEAGTYKVLVNGLVAEFTVAEFTVSEPPPSPSATFEVTNLSISPAKVKAGETVTISVLVTETSGGSGDHNVILKINGVVMEQHEVTLGSQQSQTVTFTIANQEAGGCKVEVSGLVGEFIVEVPPSEVSPPPAPTPPSEPALAKPINWWLIGGVIAAVAAVAGLVYLVLIYRRYKHVAKRYK